MSRTRRLLLALGIGLGALTAVQSTSIEPDQRTSVAISSQIVPTGELCILCWPTGRN